MNEILEKILNAINKSLEVPQQEEKLKRSKIFYLSFGLFGAIRGQPGMVHIEPPVEEIEIKQS